VALLHEVFISGADSLRPGFYGDRCAIGQ